jgi:hypothetical protein
MHFVCVLEVTNPLSCSVSKINSSSRNKGEMEGSSQESSTDLRRYVGKGTVLPTSDVFCD